MFARTVFVSLSLLSLVFTLPFASAEDERGRLPDGRAFRTDAQGNQLVDYIAELELAVEGLQRRVNGLEDEVKAKQAQVQRLQGGNFAEPQLKEKDIGGAVSSTQVATNCDQYVKQVKHYAQLLEDKKLDAEIIGQRHTEELEKAKSDVRKLEAALREKSEENATILAKVSGNEREIEDLRKEKESVAVQLAEQKALPPRVVEVPRIESQPVLERKPLYISRDGVSESRAGSDAFMKSRSQAVQSLQDKMLKDISSLEGLIASRNTLYQQYTRKVKNPDMKPQEIETSRRKIESLRRQVQSASMVHELAGIRGDINELRGEVQQEIAQMRRVVR